MKYNFDEVIERRGTDSVKWDGVENVWGRKDLLPMWVADMDFRTPPFVMDALRRRLDHEVLGYTLPVRSGIPLFAVGCTSVTSGMLRVIC